MNFKNFKISKLLLVLLVSFFFASCSIQRRCEINLFKAQKFGCLNLKKDSVYVPYYIKGDSTKIEIKLVLDTAKLDSILNTIADTCITKENVREIIKYLPAKANSYFKEDSNYSLKINLINGSFNVDIKIKPKTIQVLKETNTTEIKYLDKELSIWIKLLIGALVGIILIMLIKMK